MLMFSTNNRLSYLAAAMLAIATALLVENTVAREGRPPGTRRQAPTNHARAFLKKRVSRARAG